MQYRHRLLGCVSLILLFLAPAIGSGDATVQVSVPANQAWTDTGIDLALGSNVTITASGTIRIAGSDPGKTPAGAPECSAPSDFLAPGLPCWSLIGRIGNGTPFYVGAATGFSVTTSGRLFLGVNDNFFPDNSGSWAATVSIASEPAGGSITAHKFEDTNQNGVQDIGEEHLSGWNIVLHQDSECVGTVIDSNTTGIDGKAIFSELTAGNYSVGEVLQPAWISSADICQNVNLVVGQTHSVDFGNAPLQLRLPVENVIVSNKLRPWKIINGYQQSGKDPTHRCSPVPTYGCSDGFAWDLQLNGDPKGNVTTQQDAFPLAPGKVAFVSNPTPTASAPNPNTIIILSHGFYLDPYDSVRQLCSLYAHLDRVDVTTGRELTSTDIALGSIGQRGTSVVHLHVALYSRPLSSPECGITVDGLRRPEPFFSLAAQVLSDDQEQSDWPGTCAGTTSVDGVTALTNCVHNQYKGSVIASP